jgi:hypothetical protein
MHRPFEALAATLLLHPFVGLGAASASCVGIVTTVIVNAPISASAATMAKIARVVCFSIGCQTQDILYKANVSRIVVSINTYDD